MGGADFTRVGCLVFLASVPLSVTSPAVAQRACLEPACISLSSKGAVPFPTDSAQATRTDIVAVDSQGGLWVVPLPGQDQILRFPYEDGVFQAGHTVYTGRVTAIVSRGDLAVYAVDAIDHALVALGAQGAVARQSLPAELQVLVQGVDVSGSRAVLNGIVRTARGFGYTLHEISLSSDSIVSYGDLSTVRPDDYPDAFLVPFAVAPDSVTVAIHRGRLLRWTKGSRPSTALEAAFVRRVPGSPDWQTKSVAVIGTCSLALQEVVRDWGDHQRYDTPAFRLVLLSESGQPLAFRSLPSGYHTLERRRHLIRFEPTPDEEVKTEVFKVTVATRDGNYCSEEMT